MSTTLADLQERLERIKHTFGQEKMKKIDLINEKLGETQEGIFYFQEHPYKCQCNSCTSVAEFENKIAEVMRFPFWEEDKIGKIYPTKFLQFIDSCKVEDNLIQARFYIENQEYRLLDNFWNENPNEYNHILEVNSFSTRYSNNPKNETYKDYILLPFAKETNGFDNYGYLFFLSKIDSNSDGKIYYLDVNWASKIALVANCIDDILTKKTFVFADILNQTKFINEFLKNHEITFDKENRCSNCSLEEINHTTEFSKLKVGECHFKLCKMEGDLCFTSIYNSFTFLFSHENTSYILNCSVAYDDNVNDWNYQKLYERYFFYDDKESAIGHYAEIKQRLKVLLYDTLHKIKDFLAEKRIDILDILTDEHLQELEKAFTTPVEIDYYED